MLLIIALIILQVIIFGGLVLVFRKIMLTNVVSATQHLEEMSREFAKKEEEINKKAQELQRSEQDILSRARTEGEKSRNEIIKRAEDERDNMLKTARAHADDIVAQADQSRQQLIGELDDKIAKEAVRKACELIKETLPDSFQKCVHDQWVEDLLEHGFTHIDRLRIPEAENTVTVVSACPLSEMQRSTLNLKIAGSLGRAVQIKEEVDPTLVAGVVISIGSLVLDGSLKTKIYEKAR